MNLVELKGYNHTKDHLDKNRSSMLEESVISLESQLLQYRREHNIFEVGDYIIHDNELKVFAMWSSAVKDCAYIGYAYEENGEIAHKDEFRHATTAEIEAGKRL